VAPVHARPDLTVVVPIHNEAPNLEPLHRELTETLERWGRAYELIFVDDGSTDASWERIARIQAGDARVVAIQFRRNFGQTAAFAAGFAQARGRVIVTSDGDLQNDPRDIPALIARLDEGGFDIVCGWRKDRKDAFLSRRLPSHLANRLISWATGVRLNDYGCSLKAFRSEVVKPLRLYGELHRFLPALASEMGVRIAEQPVNHRARAHGQSKYGISRTIRVVLDLITVKFLLSYSTRPLQIFGLVGFGLGLAGGTIALWLAYLKLVERQGIGDRPLLLLAILLISTGFQLVTVGLLAELQARTYHESQSKPIYIIREVLRTDEAPLAAAGSLPSGHVQHAPR
jgi:glycosyltransferase involved in cell wall biosynthesis